MNWNYLFVLQLSEESWYQYRCRAYQPYSGNMMKVRNLGRKSLEEVLAKLKELGLQLNQGEE